MAPPPATTAPFSFSKRFIEPLEDCEPVPEELLDEAQRAIDGQWNFAQTGWKNLERVLALEARNSEDVRKLKTAYLDDNAVNRFLKMVCNQKILDAKAHVMEQARSAKVVDLTLSDVHQATLDSSGWPALVAKVQEGKATAEEGHGQVARMLRREGVADVKHFRQLDILFLPWLVKEHWTLGVLHPAEKKYGLLNSLESGVNIQRAEEKRAEFREAVERLLALVFGQKDFTLAVGGWGEVGEKESESAEQWSGADCGAYVCINAVAVVQGRAPHRIFMSKMRGVRKGIAAVLAHGRFEDGVVEL